MDGDGYMATKKIATLKDKDQNIKFPRTVSDAVLMNDGTGQNLYQKMQSMASKQDVADAVKNLSLGELGIDYSIVTYGKNSYNYRIAKFDRSSNRQTIENITDSTNHASLITQLITHFSALEKIYAYQAQNVDESNKTEDEFLAIYKAIARVILDYEHFELPSDFEINDYILISVVPALSTKAINVKLEIDSVNTTPESVVYKFSFLMTNDLFGVVKRVLQAVPLHSTNHLESFKTDEEEKKLFLYIGNEYAKISNGDGGYTKEKLQEYTLRIDNNVKELQASIQDINSRNITVDYETQVENKPTIPVLNYRSINYNGTVYDYTINLKQSSSGLLIPPQSVNADNLSSIIGYLSNIDNLVKTEAFNPSFSFETLINSLNTSNKNTFVSLLTEIITTSSNGTQINEETSFIISLKPILSNKLFTVELKYKSLVDDVITYSVFVTLSNSEYGLVQFVTDFVNGDILLSSETSINRIFVTSVPTVATVEAGSIKLPQMGEDKTLIDFYNSYSGTVSQVSSMEQQIHSHSNKEFLDTLTQDFINGLITDNEIYQTNLDRSTITCTTDSIQYIDLTNQPNIGDTEITVNLPSILNGTYKKISVFVSIGNEAPSKFTLTDSQGDTVLCSHLLTNTSPISGLPINSVIKLECEHLKEYWLCSMQSFMEQTPEETVPDDEPQEEENEPVTEE